MSFSCGVECVLFIGCTRWMWKRCTYIGSDDSATWTTATADEFAAVPRICRLILAVYETDLTNPTYTPAAGNSLSNDCLLKRVTYEQAHGRCTPYIIYRDDVNKEIVLAMRGLNLARESDYKVLLDNKLGMQMFDGGYVHHGLLKSAIWVLNQEGETLRRLWEESGKEYKMVFAGHSLGSGVAALLTVIVVNHRERLGGIPREKIRCYAIAPARCMSLNLAVKYADVIQSIVLQIMIDKGIDSSFVYRTISCRGLQLHWKIFSSQSSDFDHLDSLPCLLFLVCLRDTFIPEGRKLRDPRRLYVPGRIYHIVERKFCRCGRFPPEIRTAIPVDGRFEHIVLSCNATSDHGIVCIEREAEKALRRMMEGTGGGPTAPPKAQKMERIQTLEKEHKDALERAVSLNVPHAVSDADAEDEGEQEEEEEEKEEEEGPARKEEESRKNKSSRGGTNWDELVKKLFRKGESGVVKVNKDVPVTSDSTADHQRNPPRIFELNNGTIRVQITNYGAAITSLSVPDNDGNPADVVLGFDSVETYMEGNPCFFGCIVGRVANRIKEGKFSLDGVDYSLPINNGPNSLHGGNKGFDKVVWDVVEHKSSSEQPSVTFKYESHDGEEGYPGDVTVTATYTLTSSNTMKLDMEAVPKNKATPINLAQHTYWNLAGHKSGTILDHSVQLHASKFTPVDENSIPTGEILPVKGTPFDFTTEKKVGTSINEVGIGYDHNYVVDDAGEQKKEGGLKHVAKVKDPSSCRVLNLWATAPGVQFYTANYVAGVAGKEGAVYEKHSGLCLETQGFPNAVNEPKFPSVVVRQGEKYRHSMLFEFSVEK
ncbi:Galactose mutarotase [Linum perenne]